MADIKWGTPLKEHQRSNPAVFHTNVNLPSEIITPSNFDLMMAFQVEKFGKGKRLKTWGRKQENGKTVLTDDPHWIAVRNGTPLHTDPKYPRYSHQLKIRVDAGTFVRGQDKQELELKRGIFYILDTHSPHQVFLKHKMDAWNVSISIDSHEMWEPQKAIETCIEWGKRADFVTGELR